MNAEEMTWKGIRLKDMTKKQLIELCAHVMVLHLMTIAEKVRIDPNDIPMKH